MEAIQYIKSVPRYLTVRLLGKRWQWLYTSAASCIRLAKIDEPQLPTPDWVKIETHLSGICGSDLATITAKGSPYFSPFTSSPFVLGHEVVGEIAEVGSGVEGYDVGSRVVIEPVLSCEIRGIAPQCYQCQRGQFANCENITRGKISAGIQTGYCRDTGGGWSTYFLAHKNQLHRVPDDLSDEIAVLIEPFACALHAVLKAHPRDTDDILIIGAGTMGLLTVSAIRAIGKSNRILIVAKYPHQQKLARDLGADEILLPNKALYASFCRLTDAESYQPELGKPVLLGGVNVTFDCVASASTIDDALRFTRAQGRVVLVGMPAVPKNIDWTSIWYKELKVSGAYTYGIENTEGEPIRTFPLGIQLLQKMGHRLLPLIGERFSLKDYRRAIQSALHTGKSGSVKTIFDQRLPAG
ncbi:MAG: alcohol dehydrogenase catalytic domain-containing protein [Candidatus Poribacteria bacterium]|nr:alcohol dehydrogenase catalytic domain-containing protein [Candidatus Poribacteria bacterium]